MQKEIYAALYDDETYLSHLHLPRPSKYKRFHDFRIRITHMIVYVVKRKVVKMQIRNTNRTEQKIEGKNVTCKWILTNYQQDYNIDQRHASIEIKPRMSDNLLLEKSLLRQMAVYDQKQGLI